jgi:uncharacterized membrane protein
MIRSATIRSRAARRDPIAWRGWEVSRLEALTDGMFGFAITLLVVSVEVPESFDEMMIRVSGFLAFGFCFAMMLWVWAVHNRYFRRFGLDGGWVTALNSALVFVVLFFVYPLKFVALSLVAHLRERFGGSAGPNPPKIEIVQVPMLFVIYGVGFLALFAILALMYMHALQCKEDLELRETEIRAARLEIQRHLMLAAIGLGSAAVAFLTRNIYFSGFFYGLIGPCEWFFAHRLGKLPPAEALPLL